MTALQEQNRILQEQNRILQEQNRILQEQNIALQTKLDEREQVILELQANLITLQNLLFGKSSEQTQNETKGSNNNGNGASQGSGKGNGSKGKKGGHRKRRDHAKLPLVETSIDLPEDKKKCPCCGLDFHYVNDVEEGETVEIEVKGYRKKIRRRSYARKCKCANGGPRIITAASPGKIIPKGNIGTSVWIKLLLDKFLFYMPTYRTLDQLQLEGIDLAQSTINDGIFKIKALLDPIYQAICEKNREEERWNADETGWLVQEKIKGKETTRWYIWVFNAASTIAYILSPTRSAETLFNHLGDADGTISCDRYSAYKKYALECEGNISLSYCWAHVRRDYLRIGKAYPKHREWANVIVEKEIRQLYVLHGVYRKAYLAKGTDSEEFKQAQETLQNDMIAFHKKRKVELDMAGLDECQRKANESLMEHWHGLTEVMLNPELDMDNNAAERSLRGPVVGRKNFWGSMMEWSGQLAVMMFTICQTLLLWGINPKGWLELYFGHCAANKGKSPTDIQEYLPWNMSNEMLENLSIDTSIQSPDPPE
jgi:transposase